MRNKEKVLLGMSGGKDSTWSCRVLQEKGYEVEGLLLVLHGDAPIEKATLAASRLGIKLHIADYTCVFKEKVENAFCNEYFCGRTPNPCVECNYHVKFASLIKEADRLGIDKIATGHYVTVSKESGGRYVLSEGADKAKDQSYFLWKLSQEQLSRFIAPLSEIDKDRVVEGVTVESLIDKIEESQEICFIPDDYTEYLKENLPLEKREKAFGEGNFVSVDGEILGKHKGYASYTVGQRKGLGIALGRPAFVVDIRPNTREVVLGFEESNRINGFFAEGLNFVSIDEFEGELDCFVRPRYRSPKLSVRVKINDGRAEVMSEVPIKSVAKGQSAVFYDNEGRVLFGGYAT